MRSSRLAVLAVALVAFCPSERSESRADDGAAEDAAAKVLAAKALATFAAPAEQWLGSYAGSCWTQSLRVSIAKEGDLRRVEIEIIKSHEKELASRDHDKWWFDAAGTLVKGERKTFEAGQEAAELDLKYEVKNGKISVRQVDQPTTSTAELPKKGNFVPDKLVALFVVPDEKGGKWRFLTLGGEHDFLPFTVEDLGKEKIALRAGTVEARKLRVTEPGGEALYWLDAERRIVSARWPSLANLQAISGTEEESRADWWTRPQDDADKAAEKLMKSGADFQGQAGSLAFGVYNEEGHLKATAVAKLGKETTDGKALHHYAGSISEVGSGATVSTEDWTFAPDGKLVAGKYTVKGSKVDTVECKIRVEGDKMISTISDAPEGKEELSFPIPPCMVADSYFLMKPCAKAGPGSYRFNGFDLAGRYVYSIHITVKGEEEITLLKGKVKARRLELTQNVAEADVWVDANGELLLIAWKDGDRNVFGPIDSMPQHLPDEVGPPKK
ncbi:MAG: hypothetical protein ACAI25_08810 [Planctomycetota bacterium]